MYYTELIEVMPKIQNIFSEMSCFIYVNPHYYSKNNI